MASGCIAQIPLYSPFTKGGIEGDYSLIAEDRDYGADSYGADFDGSAALTTKRLVTTSWDGFIRLYNPPFDKGWQGGFKLIAKESPPGGSQPFSVSFSPDGSKIVVGFSDSTRVDVLSGRDLSYLYSPDTTGVDNGNLNKVSWSSDGRFLYAGGKYNKNGIFPIRKWSDGGKGRYDDLSAANNTIMPILPLRDGGIVFGSADPTFGIFDVDDRKAVYKEPVIADYRNNLEGFLISYDGMTIQFGYEVFGKSPAIFSVSERTLNSDLQTPNLPPPSIPPLLKGGRRG